MSILTWIEDKKRLKVLNAPKHVGTSTDSSKGLWTRCDKCGVILYIKHLKENQRVCFGCSYHLQMMSGERIENLLDRVPAISSLSPPSQGIERGAESTASSPASFTKEDSKTTRGKAPKNSNLDVSTSLRSGIARSSSRESMISTWRALDETLSPCDPLKFHDQKAYRDRLQDAQERTGLQDAIQTGTGMIDGIPVALAVMDFSFMGGSMGSVVGEKITRLIEYATQEGITLLIISASGGARMQEGVFSLMQMAKISSALQIYQSCARLLYISILTSPTTGGVTASFAMLGDIIFAEPKALIAFAGRRVIEQTLREDLPDDFQTSEYMLHHGLVDLIVPRRFLRQALSESIRLYQGAPFKKKGEISFGVQNPISFLTEEKIRRQWGRLTKPGTKAFYSPLFNEAEGVKSIEKNGSLPRTKEETLTLSEVSYKALLQRSKASLLSLGDEISTLRSENSLHEALRVSQKEVSRTTDQLIEKSRLSSDLPTEMYREILTSFEGMLPVLLSSNNDQQNEKLGDFFTPSYLSSPTLTKGTHRRNTYKEERYSSPPSELSSFSKLSIKTANSSSILWLYNGIVTPSHRHILKLKKRVFSKKRDYKNKLGFFSSKKFLQRSNIDSAYENPMQSVKPFSQKYSYNSLSEGLTCKSSQNRITSTNLLAYKSPICMRSFALISRFVLGGRTSTRIFLPFKKRSAPSLITVNDASARTSKNQRFVRSFALVLAKRFVRSFALVKQRKFLHKNQGGESSAYNGANVRKKAFICILDTFVVTKRRFSPCFVYKALYSLRNTTTSLTAKRGKKIRNLVWHETKRTGVFHLEAQKPANKSMIRTRGGRTWAYLDVRPNQSKPNQMKYVHGEDLHGDKQVQSFAIFRKSKYDAFSKISKGTSASNFYVPFLKQKESTLTRSKVIFLSRNESYIKDGQKMKSRGLSSISRTRENNISFLNQAIELAATESVEWRAFYMASALSEETASFEDFLQQDSASFEKRRTVLFYKLLCRSEKTVSE